MTRGVRRLQVTTEDLLVFDVTVSRWDFWRGDPYPSGGFVGGWAWSVDHRVGLGMTCGHRQSPANFPTPEAAVAAAMSYISRQEAPR